MWRHDAKLVRTETLCALRCVTVAKAFVSRSEALNRAVAWVWIWPSSCVILDLPEVLALMESAQKTHGGSIGVFVRAVHAIRDFGQIVADLFQLSPRDSTGCVTDVSVLMPSTRAAQPMRTDEDFVRVGRLKNTQV